MKKMFIALMCLGLVVLFAAETADIVPTPTGKVGKQRVAAPKIDQRVDYDFASGRALLIWEDFEGGVVPAGWTVIDANADGYTWEVGTTSDLLGNDPPSYGTAYAYYSDDDAGSGAPLGTEYLIAPAKDCSGLTALEFSYGWGFYIYSTPYGAIWVRFHNGVSWGAWILLETIYVNSTGTSFWNLAGYLPADSVQVQFTYEDKTQGWGWAFGIDNVLLEEPPVYDAGCSAVLSPPDGAVSAGSHSVDGRIENYGQYTETFNATADVYETGSSTPFWTSTQSVTLASGAYSDVNFGNVTLAIDKFFDVVIYTQLGGDEEPANDTAYAYPRTALGFGDIVLEIDAEAATGDIRLLGIEFDGTYFYLTGAYDFTICWVHVLDAAGNWVTSMLQPSWTWGDWGWRDICDDADYFYSSYTMYVDRFTLDVDNSVLTYQYSFPGPEYPNRALACDPYGWFYTANFSSYCWKWLYDWSAGYGVYNTYAMYGAAYDTDPDEGGWIWWHSQDGIYPTYLQVEQMDAATMTFTGTNFNYYPVLNTGIYCVAGGACFYEGFNGMDVLFTLVQGTPDQIVGIFIRYDQPPIPATVDMKPESFNPKSKGTFVTCYIEVPDYDVNDIDVNTVRITKINGSGVTEIYAAGPYALGDYDGDSEPDLMVKFDRWEFNQALDGVFGETYVTVAGDIGDDKFEGTDMVWVLEKWDGGVAGGEIPAFFMLYENAPNPFSAHTLIRYAIPTPTQVNLNIYDATGRAVKSLVNGEVGVGFHNLRWDGRDNVGRKVASGVYFVKFETEQYQETRKLVVLR